MSFSENSTLRPLSRDSHQSLDGPTRGVGALAVNSYAQSPYTDPDLYSLDVGPNKTRFRVHRMILSQSPELEVKPSGMLWGESTSDSLALPELDEPTAHTLVHYLYSGRYQTLDSFSDTSDKAGTVSAYRLGTCVYCAAMRYQLPGLAELAKERITTIAEELTILDILGVAREHAFPNLPQAESWYPSYLEGAIKAAVTEDPELFMKPEFVDQIEGDRRFRQVVMSAVVNSYSKGMSGLSDRTAGVSTPMTDAKAEPLDTSVVTEPERQLLKDAIQDPQEQTSPKTTEAVGPPASNDRVPEPDQQLAGGPKGETAAEPFLEKDELELDEIEPSAPAPPKPEPFTDELGFASSKTYQKMGQKDANPGNSRLALDTESAAPMHKRVDSAIQAPENGAIESASSEHAITTPSEIAKLDASNAPIAAEVSANGASVTPKKVKKKKKKTAAAKE